MALQDIQTEEYTRDLQAQQEAAERQAEEERAAAAAAAKKAARKQQRQRKQAKLRAAAEAQQSTAVTDASTTERRLNAYAADLTSADEPVCSDETCHLASATANVNISDGSKHLPGAATAERCGLTSTDSASLGSTNQRRHLDIRNRRARVLVAERPKSRGVLGSTMPKPSHKELKHQGTHDINAADKPRVLEVRRPKKPSQTAQPTQ